MLALGQQHSLARHQAVGPLCLLSLSLAFFLWLSLSLPLLPCWPACELVGNKAESNKACADGDIVLAWGDNHRGQFGDGKRTSRPTPEKARSQNQIKLSLRESLTRRWGLIGVGSLRSARQSSACEVSAERQHRCLTLTLSAWRLECSRLAQRNHSLQVFTTQASAYFCILCATKA